jgi:hypothetical protein
VAGIMQAYLRILVLILQFVQKLLECKEIDTYVINKSGETALDIAERTGRLCCIF